MARSERTAPRKIAVTGTLGGDARLSVVMLRIRWTHPGRQHLPSPPFSGGEETASRSAFQRKSHAVGEGQPFVPALLPPVQSKRLPLTCRFFLAFGSGDIHSPKVGGEE